MRWLLTLVDTWDCFWDTAFWACTDTLRVGLTESPNHVLVVVFVEGWQRGTKPIQSLFDTKTKNNLLNQLWSKLPEDNLHFLMSPNTIISSDKYWSSIQRYSSQCFVTVSVKSSVRNSNLGLCFPPFKCCISQLSVDRFGNNLGWLMTLGQVKSSLNICSFGPQRDEKRNIWRGKTQT